MSVRTGTRPLFAIAAREVSERAALLGLAAFVAVLPSLFPLTVREMPFLRVFYATVMTGAAAVLTGSSVIARDLAEGRLGFFLARPIPWWSIWAGKWVAALVLTFAAGSIVILPALFAGDLAAPSEWWLVAVLAPSVLVLIGGVHAATVGYRSRSPWFAAELALAAGLGWVMVRTSRTLLAYGLWPYGIDAVSGALWVLAAAVTIAGAVQVARGGTDIRRAHRVLAIVLWSMLAPTVAGYAAWAAWVGRISPADLGSIASARPSADGAWMVAVGRARAPRPKSVFAGMLVEPRTGRFLPLGNGLSSRPAMSGDGSRVVWMAHTWGDEPKLFSADLRSGPPSAVPLPLPIPPGAVFGLTLSRDGTHAGVVQARQATVFALGSAQAAVVLATPLVIRELPFSSDGVAHALVGREEWSKPGVLDVVALDPTTRHTTVTGQVATRGHPIESWGPNAARVVVLHRPDFRPSLTLHDGTTGALLATLVVEGSTGRVSSTFLHDGRLAVVQAGDGIRLRVFSRDGAEMENVLVAPQFGMARAVEVGDGVVAVELPYQGVRGTSNSILVDLTTGRVMRTEPGLRPASGGSLPGDTGSAPGPTNLFIDDRGTLVRMDLATGTRTAVLGGG